MDARALAFNLRWYRKRRGWIMAQLAEASGLSKATVSRMEAGQTTSETMEQVPLLARALGLTVAQLTEWPGDQGPRRLHEGAMAYRVRLAGEGPADPAGGMRLPDDGPDPDRFVLVVVGDCLADEIDPGDYLDMSASREPRPGDVVSVLYAGERHIKRLVARNGEWVLASRHGLLRLPAGESWELEGVMVTVLEPKRPREEADA